MLILGLGLGLEWSGLVNITADEDALQSIKKKINENTFV